MYCIHLMIIFLTGRPFYRKLEQLRFSPIFYQYVGDHIFKQLINSKYPVSDKKAGEEVSEMLTYPE